MTTYVEKLQAWFEDEKKNGRLVDIKFFPHYFHVPGQAPIKLFDGPDPTVEECAKAAYMLVTGQIPCTEVDVARDIDGIVDVSDQNI